MYLSYENPNDDSAALWKTRVQTLQSDLNTDIRAITGQSETVVMSFYQCNQLSVRPETSGTNYNYGYPTDVINAQKDLIETSNNFIAATPIYQMEFYTSASGRQVHITGIYQKLAGYYYGKAISDFICGKDTKKLAKASITVSSDRTKITITTDENICLNADTYYVRETTHLGFNVVTSDNRDILQSVSVERYKIVLTLSEPLVLGSTKVRYAVNNDVNLHSGWYDGSRGNIRDTQGLNYYAEI